MQPGESEDSNRDTRRALLFTATVYALILAAVLVLRRHPAQDAVLVILGAVCLVIAVVYIVLAVRMLHGPLFAWVKFLGFLLIGASCIVSGWWGDSDYTEYAIWLATASFVVSFLLVWRYRRSVQGNTDQQR